MGRGNEFGELGIGLTDLSGAKSGMTQGEALAERHKLGAGLLNDRILALAVCLSISFGFAFGSSTIGGFVVLFWIISMPAYYWTKRRRLERIRHQQIEQLRLSEKDIQ